MNDDTKRIDAMLDCLHEQGAWIDRLLRDIHRAQLRAAFASDRPTLADAIAKRNLRR